MIKRKFIIPLLYLIVSFMYFGFVIYEIVSSKMSDLIPLFRVSRNFNALGDVLIAFLVPMVLMVILAFLGKPFAKLNYKIMTRVQKNFEYYYVDIGVPNHRARQIISRSLPAVFLALAFSLLLSNITIFENLFGVDIASAIIMLSLLLTPLSCFLMLPLYIFMDSGIVKIRKKGERKRPPEINYFGNAQYKAYKGFAGLTTPIMYFITIAMQGSLSGTTAYIILLYPIFLIGIFMPFFIVYEKQIAKWHREIVEKLDLKLLRMEDVERNIF